MKTFLMLLRREWWENRGGFLWAPAITAGVVLLLAAMGMVLALWHTSGQFNGEIHIGVPLKKLTQEMDAAQLANLGLGLDGALAGLWGLVQVVSFFVLFFYLLGALYDERRDRSILFWKSLPVSDRDTVLAKVATATLVAPALALAIAIALQIGFLVLLCGFVLVNGLDPRKLVIGPAEPLALWVKMIATLPVNALWALPAVGWLLLCSSFARSKPFLWAVLLPVGVGVLIGFFDLLETLKVPEAWYWINVVARLLGSLVPVSWSIASSDFGGDGAQQVLTWAAFGTTLSSTTLWVGAVAGAAAIAAAIHFRRVRELAD